MENQKDLALKILKEMKSKLDEVLNNTDFSRDSYLETLEAVDGELELMKCDVEAQLDCVKQEMEADEG